MDISKIPPELINAGFKLIMFFMGFFGSIIVAIISYFLGSFFKNHREFSKEISLTVHSVEKKIVGIEKDIDYLRTCQGRRKRPWKANKISYKP